MKEYNKKLCRGWQYYVKTPPNIQPKIPPTPVAIQENAIKFYDPCSGSFLAYTHIIASATTFTNASDKAANVKNIATVIALVSLRK